MQTNDVINQLREQVSELQDQLVEVKKTGGTGQSPCARFCESVALSKDLKRISRENDALAAQVVALAAILSEARNSDESEDVLGCSWHERCSELALYSPLHHLAAHDAEVAAKAVEEFSEFALNELSKTVVVAYSGCRGTDSGDLSDLSVIETDEFTAIKTEYAAQLRAKVGE